MLVTGTPSIQQRTRPTRSDSARHYIEHIRPSRFEHVSLRRRGKSALPQPYLLTVLRGSDPESDDGRATGPAGLDRLDPVGKPGPLLGGGDHSRLPKRKAARHPKRRQPSSARTWIGSTWPR